MRRFVAFHSKPWAAPTFNCIFCICFRLIQYSIIKSCRKLNNAHHQWFVLLVRFLLAASVVRVYLIHGCIFYAILFDSASEIYWLTWFTKIKQTQKSLIRAQQTWVIYISQVDQSNFSVRHEILAPFRILNKWFANNAFYLIHFFKNHCHLQKMFLSLEYR